MTAAAGVAPRLVTFYDEAGQLALVAVDQIALIVPRPERNTVFILLGGSDWRFEVQGTLIQVAARLGIDAEDEGGLINVTGGPLPEPAA